MTHLLSPKTEHLRWRFLFKSLGVLLAAVILSRALLRPTDLPSSLQWLFIVTAAAISAFQLPGIFLENLNRRLTNRRARSALIIFIVAGIYLLTTALLQHRDLLPELHDENAYVLQARMLAHGRLWMPALPLPDFFQTFFVFTSPVYASIYFPGTALVNAPAILLHLPLFVTPLLLSAASVAIIFLIFCCFFDGLTGLLATFLVISGMPFRRLSITVMSHPLMLAEGAAMILLFLRWQRRRKTSDMLFLGAVTGLALITRPADAMCYAIPLLIAVLVTSREAKTFRQLSFAIAAILPFIALQLVLNLGTTGHLFHAPYSLYLEKFQPGSEPGFHQAPPALSGNVTLHQQMYFKTFLLPGIHRHTLKNIAYEWLTIRLGDLIRLAYYACPIMGILCALYFLRPRVRGWAIMAGILLLMVLCYTLNPMFLIHYGLSFLPVLIFPLMAVIYVVRTRWPNSRISTFAALGLIALCISSLPEFDPQVQDAWLSPLMRFVHDELPQRVKQPCVVLFASHPQDDISQEPVYNVDTINPDDSPMIHAQDLGPRNREIFAYYAKHQPNREFYIFDRATDELKDLGTAAQLSRATN